MGGRTTALGAVMGMVATAVFAVAAPAQAAPAVPQDGSVLMEVRLNRTPWVASMRSDGTGPQRIVKGSGGWTNNNGRRFAYQAPDGRLAFWDVIDKTATVTPHQLSGTPSWSPDGKFLAWTNGPLSLVVVSTTAPFTMTVRTFPEFSVSLSGLSWLDPATLVSWDNRDWTLISIPVDPAISFTRLGGFRDLLYASVIAVSPDRTRILIDSETGVFHSRLDGSDRRIVPNAGSAAWSPDSRHVVATTQTTTVTGARRLVMRLVAVDGSGEIVAQVPGAVVSWSPRVPTLAATPKISISDVVVDEAAVAVFRLTLDAVPTRQVVLRYATSGLTSTDIQPVTWGTLRIPAGRRSAEIRVQTVKRWNDEPDETFSVLLMNAANGLIADPVGLGLILDYDVDQQG